MIRSLEELTPQAREAADRWLGDVLAGVRPDLREDLRGDLVAHLCEHLDASATADDVVRVAASLGDVADAADEGGTHFFARLGAGFNPRGLGSRLARTLWNPADERLFLPRAFGLGWDLNFGAVAVRLGLIEPDAEAVPFTSTPDEAFRVAAVVPVGLAAATVLHYLVRGRRLPDRLPSHWALDGTPDRWVGRPTAVAVDVGTAVVSAGLAAWAAGSSRPSGSRVGALAAATLAGGLGATTTLARSVRRPGPLLTPLMLTGATAGVGAVLLWLAREGRRVEIEKDVREEDE